MAPHQFAMPPEMLRLAAHFGELQKRNLEALRPLIEHFAEQQRKTVAASAPLFEHQRSIERLLPTFHPGFGK